METIVTCNLVLRKIWDVHILYVVTIVVFTLRQCVEYILYLWVALFS